MRRFLFPAFSLLAGLAAVLMVLEVVLRFLPVSEGLRTLTVDDHNPVVRFEPERVSTWSRFPDFAMRNAVRTNNYGFVSEVDYRPEDRRPLVAIIGDSYVEAVMVPPPSRGSAVIRDRLGGTVRVYSFGSSGSALSQYLAYAAWARDTFAPEKVICVVVGNDFDESLLEYRSVPAFHYFAEDGRGGIELVRLDWSPSLAVRAARSSRLALYLVNNLDVFSVPGKLGGLFTSRRGDGDDRFVANTSASLNTARLEASSRAVSFFLSSMAEYAGLPPESILFAVDGMRPHLYGEETLRDAEESYFGVMRRRFIEEAGSRGYSTVDLQPHFIAEHRRRGVRFEYERDGHWNGEGHDLFARAVLASGFLDTYGAGKDSGEVPP